MTSLPVSDLKFGLKGFAAVGKKEAASEKFRDVWSEQSGKGVSGQSKTNGMAQDEKTPGDSLKVREEYRVRTNKREPIRNVEERADISDEELQEVAEVLSGMMEQLLQRVADRLEVTPEQLQESMVAIDIEPLDLFDNGAVSQLVLHVDGIKSMTDLVTNEALYGEYREIMDIVGETLQDASGQLELTEGKLFELLHSDETVGQLQGYLGEESNEAQDFVVQTGGIPQTEEKEFPEPDEGKGSVKGQDVSINSDQTVDGSRQNVENEMSKNESKNENSHSGDGREEMHNFVLQTAKEGQFETQVEEVQETFKGWDTGTRDIMDQIMDYMKINLKGELSDVEMQLHPASLGTLQIQVASKGGVITANFVTQNEAVKAVLESQMIQLKEQFEEQGVRVEAIEVTVQTHEFEQNLDQGRGNRQAGQEPSKKARIRKIDLNSPPGTEETTKEEQLTRSMMEADGNTVDYMA